MLSRPQQYDQIPDLGDPETEYIQGLKANRARLVREAVKLIVALRRDPRVNRSTLSNFIQDLKKYNEDCTTYGTKDCYAIFGQSVNIEFPEESTLRARNDFHKIRDEVLQEDFRLNLTFINYLSILRLNSCFNIVLNWTCMASFVIAIFVSSVSKIAWVVCFVSFAMMIAFVYYLRLVNLAYRESILPTGGYVPKEELEALLADV